MSDGVEHHQAVQRCLLHYRDRMAGLLVDAPEDVRVELTPSLGPPAVSIARVSEVEQSLPGPLAPWYVAYLTGSPVDDVEWDEYVLPGNRDETNWSEPLLDRELWPLGLVRFAMGPCGDPVCFDLRCPTDEGDYAVVVINHDMVPEGAWSRRSLVEPHMRTLAPSFAAFLEGLCEGNMEPAC